jgi:hypothetical protein
MVQSMFERELLVAERQDALLREAEAARLTSGRPLRERVAAALMALALRLAPAAREAIPTESVATGAAR